LLGVNIQTSLDVLDSRTQRITFAFDTSAWLKSDIRIVALEGIRLVPASTALASVFDENGAKDGILLFQQGIKGEISWKSSLPSPVFISNERIEIVDAAGDLLASTLVPVLTSR